MPSISYPILTFADFSRQLITTEDLDPIYVILEEARLPEATLQRWLLAYWCFYHAGVASYVAEAADFWPAMYYANANWPRGTERRHFRGAISLLALDDMAFDAPEYVVADMTAGRTFQQVAANVQQYYGFGQWIAWKVADMAERVLHLPIDFHDATLGIYRDPVKGAALYLLGDQNAPITPNQLDMVVEQVAFEFSKYQAPPSYNRPVNIQEIETFLCKWKSHVNGHYPLNKDTNEIKHGLHGYGDLATELASYLP